MRGAATLMHVRDRSQCVWFRSAMYGVAPAVVPLALVFRFGRWTIADPQSRIAL